MEIGNLLFNRCEGGYAVKRNIGFEKQLKRLFHAYAPNRDRSCGDYGEEIENQTFCVWPYSWCNCDCGFDEASQAWCSSHSHAVDCYRTLAKRAMAEWDAMNDYRAIEEASMCDIFIVNGIQYTDFVSADEALRKEHCSFSSELSEKARQAKDQWRALYDIRLAHETQTRKRLCEQFGIAWNDGKGSAIHCTCDYDRTYARWRESHTHDLRCAVARPQFLYKPESFAMTWYKYPLRDAYTNRPITRRAFRAIIDACVESLKDDPGGPVPRLKPAGTPLPSAGNLI